MIFRDLMGKTRLVVGTVPTATGIQATAVLATVDRSGYQVAQAILNFGALAGTYTGTNKWTITAEHSDDNSSWAAITDASMLGFGAMGSLDFGGGAGVAMADQANGVWILLNSTTVRDAVKSKACRLDYKGNKRYFRINATKAASGPDTFVTAEILLGDPVTAGDSNLVVTQAVGAPGNAQG